MSIMWYLSHVIKLRKTVDSETWYKYVHFMLLTFLNINININICGIIFENLFKAMRQVPSSSLFGLFKNLFKYGKSSPLFGPCLCISFIFFSFFLYFFLFVFLFFVFLRIFSNPKQSDKFHPPRLFATPGHPGWIHTCSPAQSICILVK